jgi:DEAD/DEAH box helicase domain-containing protein
MEVLDEFERDAPTGETKGSGGRYGRGYGELLVTSQVVGYRHIKRYTHETLAWEEVDMPELTKATTGAWLWVGETVLDQLHDEGVLLPPIDYGPNWSTQREAARQRDRCRCRTCNAPERNGRQHDVHHIRPFREFGYVPGENDAYLHANALDNLLTLCPLCHRRAETARRVRGALGGLAHALQQLSPLYLMCDPRDLGCAVEARSSHTRLPTITIYDDVPGGIGLSVQLYDLFGELLLAVRSLVADCGCHSGCPSCVGPVGDMGADTKDKVLRLTTVLMGQG